MEDEQVPVFMRDDVPSERPALGDLETGSEILVVDPYYQRRTLNPRAARVTKVARVWITAQEVNGDFRYPLEWRFRKDNQTNASDNSYSTHFYTPEQYLHYRAVSDAMAFLKEQKVVPNFSSPWGKDNRLVELARMVWIELHGDSLTRARYLFRRHPGMAVSMDVSTGDNDYDRRIFGTVAEVHPDTDGEPIILVEVE